MSKIIKKSKDGVGIEIDLNELPEDHYIKVMRTQDPKEARLTLEAMERDGLEMEPCVADQPDWEVLETLNKILDEFQRVEDDPDYEPLDDL